MFNVSYLPRRFRDIVLRESLEPCGKLDGLLPARIEFVTPKQAYTADRIYLCEGWPECIDEAEVEPGSLFVSCNASGATGAAEAGSAAAEGAKASYGTIVLNCSSADAYNAIAASMEETEGWARRFREERSLRDFQAVISLGGELGQCPIVMVDDDGKVLASSLSEESVLRKTRQSNLESAARVYTQRLIAEFPEDRDDLIVEENGALLFWRRIHHLDGTTGYLMVEDVDGAKDRETLCRLIAEEAAEHTASESMDSIKSNMKAFCRGFEALEERTLCSTVEIRNMFDGLPYPVDQFVSLAVVVFPDQKAWPPYREILLKLHELFPHENITVYKRDIVILLSQPVRSFRPNFESVDTERLSRMLIQHNAIMAVSQKIKQKLSGIPTLYALARQTALLAYALHDTPSKSRIVFYEDYSIYCILDMCMKQYLRSGVGDDPVYMIHSSIIQLTRYDAKHNSNLRDVLYHYLSCDRNLVKTAAATYMHRNTIVNKINKITSLLNLDLDDERLRQKLILSCQIILYVERVMERSLGLPEE